MENTGNNIRLLLTKNENVQVALPINDSINIYSGFCENTVNADLADAIEDARDEMEQTTSICTLQNAFNEKYFVAMSIKELFQKIAEASKKGENLVDLAQQSGETALIKKAKELASPKHG
ncbi:MAG: hypothetical protein OXT65_11425 [Alphaproteobacteria bacterium]|nr:hypothetical protein [Alphaproteobacteria bacterium]